MAATLHNGGNDSCANHRHLRPLLRWLLAVLLLPLMVHATTAFANELSQSQASIRDAVKAFVSQRLEKEYPHYEIKVNRLDPRLKLAACQTPLKSFLPAGGKLIGNITIGVRCTGVNPWSIYVPVSVQAMRRVVITARPILRSTTISEEDIRVEERDVATGTENYIYNPDHVLGKLAKHDLPSSVPLSPRMLSARLLIRRGQQVIILAKGPGIEVRMAGTALMDGTEGEIIRAQNKLSKRTVEGQVIQPGVIRVNM